MVRNGAMVLWCNPFLHTLLSATMDTCTPGHMHTWTHAHLDVAHVDVVLSDVVDPRLGYRSCQAGYCLEGGLLAASRGVGVQVKRLVDMQQVVRQAPASGVLEAQADEVALAVGRAAREGLAEAGLVKDLLVNDQLVRDRVRGLLRQALSKTCKAGRSCQRPACQRPRERLAEP